MSNVSVLQVYARLPSRSVSSGEKTFQLSLPAVIKGGDYYV